MDTFAAVALGSERPHPSIIKSPPVRDNEPLLTMTMWRQIYGMTLYISFVMIILYFFADDMWGDLASADQISTILFESFIYMHLFNEVNCRKVGATEFNVWHNIFSNWLFVIVVGGLMVMQIVIVEIFGGFTQCVSLSREQHAFCILWGSSTLIASALLKLIPAEITEKMPIAVDENKAVDENDPIMGMYNKHAAAKVSKPKVANADEAPVVAQE